MIFKIILIFIFLINCAGPSYNKGNKISYSTSGFAYIYSKEDYLNKFTKKKFNQDELLIGHDRLKVGSLIKLTNPESNKSIILKVNKKTTYPEFYKILITNPVAKKLEIDEKLPYIELQEIKKNKSFVAKKATTFNEEKNILNKAPVTNVSINDISTINRNKIKKLNKVFSILIGEFYSIESAKNLKKTLIQENQSLNKNELVIKKVKKNNYQLITGPYKAINSLKNDYIILKNYGFEDLEIKINE